MHFLFFSGLAPQISYNFDVIAVGKIVITLTQDCWVAKASKLLETVLVDPLNNNLLLNM